MSREDERYKFVTSQLVYFNEKIIEAFSLYVKLLTAVIGGTVWLRLQAAGSGLWLDARPLAVALVLLVGVATGVLVLFNLQTWWGYRQAESTLTDDVVAKPTFPRSCKQELAMLVVITLGTTTAVHFVGRL